MQPNETLSLRKLPPVEPCELPQRFSQTILRHANFCKRAAYLYQKHHGGMPAHALDRGSAYHLAKAKVLKLILERYALDAGPDGDIDYGVDEHTAKLILEEVLSEHPELTVPLHERDELRVMMVHLASGLRINPAHIVAVEQKFVLDLGEHTISGILDLGAIDGNTGLVRDSKTSWAFPSQTEFAATFQGRLYAVLFMFGNPVHEQPCICSEGFCGEYFEEVCTKCDGHGYTQRLEPPIGEHLQTIDVGEIYPRFSSCTACGGKTHNDGSCTACNAPMGMPEPHLVLDRIEIEALRRDIKQQCEQLAEAFKTWEFPAVPSSHCSECPMEPSCPLPAALRRYAGAINTDEQAKESAEWHALWAPRLAAAWKELKLYCKANGPLRYGKDLIAEFTEVNRWDTDWDAIEEGARRQALYGEPFDISLHRIPKHGTTFRQRKLTEAELEAEIQ